MVSTEVPTLLRIGGALAHANSLHLASWDLWLRDPAGPSFLAHIMLHWGMQPLLPPPRGQLLNRLIFRRWVGAFDAFQKDLFLECGLKVSTQFPDCRDQPKQARCTSTMI
jgi:hypothetical protein